MDAAEEQIRALVDAETAAWDTRDAGALAALFHPDTVWPWPPNSTAHDPMQWVMPLGRYNRQRWIRSWQELFDSHDLVHNRSEEHTSELQSRGHLVCRLLLEKKKYKAIISIIVVS